MDQFKSPTAASSPKNHSRQSTGDLTADLSDNIEYVQLELKDANETIADLKQKYQANEELVKSLKASQESDKSALNQLKAEFGVVSRERNAFKQLNDKYLVQINELDENLRGIQMERDELVSQLKKLNISLSGIFYAYKMNRLASCSRRIKVCGVYQ